MRKRKFATELWYDPRTLSADLLIRDSRASYDLEWFSITRIF